MINASNGGFSFLLSACLTFQSGYGDQSSRGQTGRMHAGNTLSSPTNTQRSVVRLPSPQAGLLTTPPKTTPKHLLLLNHLSFNLLLVLRANLSSGTWSNLCSVSTVLAGEGQQPITKRQEAQATSHSLGRERGRL